MDIDNSKVTITFSENYQTIEHQLIVVTKNLGEFQYFPGYELSIPSDGITNDDITNTCEILNREGTSSGKECTATNNLDENDQSKIKLKYQGQIGQEEKLIINYKYNKAKNTQEILYKQEAIVIPLIRGSSNCDYKFIIPEGYVNLGLKNNTLTKASDTTYTFYGQCPTTRQTDVIRYSLEKVSWNADMEVSLSYPPKFRNDVTLTFPRYYHGGKFKSEIYTLSSLDNEVYNEEDYIFEDSKYQIKISAANKDKVGVKLNTNFTNTLTNEFKIDVPESFYEIDSSLIVQEIKEKAEEIINEESDKPNYYKLGKFVNSYISYDISYSGKDLTVKEIYDGKKGVCEHYTKLYNAMLNAIGIKTLYISGWAFDGNQTSGNKDTSGHAWTAALIDDKWIELDATWGLFEGISAGHIMKFFDEDSYSYSCNERYDNQLSLSQDNNIKATSIEISDSGSAGSTDGGKTSDKNEEEDDESDIITRIKTSYSNYQKPSLILLILFSLI
jgi:transglutaminase-like putative cysteine protease